MIRRSPLFLGILVIGACDSAVPESLSSSAELAEFVEQSERGFGTLREVSKIGAIDGPEEYVLGYLDAFTVSPDGDVHVAENDGPIRQFDAAGRFVRNVARQGAGPGEIDYAAAMAVSPNRELVVVDFGNQRVGIWSAEGQFVRQFRTPPGRPRYGSDGIRFDQDGEIWIGLFPPRVGPDAVQPGEPRPIYGRLTGDAAVQDTVLLPERDWAGCLTRDPSYANGLYEDIREAFAPMVQWARAADGVLAVGCPASYEFYLIGGGAAERVGREWAPIVVSAEERTALRNGIGGAAVPEVKPAYTRLWIADDGRVWVRTTQESERRLRSAEEQAAYGGAPYSWIYHLPTDGMDVFEPDGRWVGHVQTPENWVATPFPGKHDPIMRGDTVWAITSGDLGEAFVSRFVVEWSR